MTATKFNVGDRVVLTQDNQGFGKEGDYATVTLPDGGDNDFMAQFDTGSSKEGSWYIAYNGARLISGSPVREVTRKEIVECVCGPLHVVPHESGCVLVGFVHPVDQQFTSLTPDELRAAAATFIELADALVAP